MKTIKFLSLASAALLLTACSSEEPINGGNDGEATGYIKVSVVTENGSRAVSYDAGEGESEIKSVAIGIYGANGARLASYDLLKDRDTEKSNGMGDLGGVIKTNLRPETPETRKVYVLVNASTESLPASLDNLSSVETTVLKDDNNYFVMSNSVYYNGTTDDTVLTVAETLSGVAEWKDIDGLDATQIYVERVAAKVSVSASDEANNAWANQGDKVYGTDITMEFTTDVWNLSNVANSSYTFKQLPSKYSDATSLVANEMTDLLGGAFTHRCFWAQGKDLGGLIKYPESGATVGQSGYYHESTVANAAKKNGTTILDQTSPFLILTGKYTVTGVDVEQDGTFYLYTTKDGKPVIYGTAEKLIQAIQSNLGYTDYTGYTLEPKSGSASLMEYVKDGVAAPTANIYKYSQGRGFYVVNINHYANDTDYTFGLVRNNAYVLNVESVTKLAEAYNGEDVPVKPENPESEYGIKATINVLDWRVNTTQNVQW